MYVPKTKIIPNQYTAGDELIYRKGGGIYQGYYHILANGTVYSGKTPNDGLPVELLFISQNNQKLKQAEPGYLMSPTSMFKVYGFGGSKLTYDRVRLPQTRQYPFTTLLEPVYTISTAGYPSFIRYFVKRTNNILFIEIDQTQYSKIAGQDNKYNWPAYTPFEITWTTGGYSRDRIKEINRNMVLLTEQRLKLTGFSNYITNYSEFAI
jgi:hypothetical protein